MSSSWGDDDETTTAAAGYLRQFRDLVGLSSAHVTPDLEREMARRTRDLMANMISQNHPTTPTVPRNGFGMPTPGTSGSPWSTSAEVRERLQAAQREGRRTIHANKLKRIQEEQQENLRRAAEEQQETADRWRRAQEERGKQADRLKAQNEAAARARANAAAATALRAQNRMADRNSKQLDHISLRLRHTRAGQAMREFSARAKAQAKAEVDGLRAQQDELALVSAQQDLDRVMLQHDLAKQIRATRRIALEEQVRQAEEDRLRAEREQADQDKAASLSDADDVSSSRSTSYFMERQGFLWGGESSLSISGLAPSSES
ncbi:hypothetical protein KCU67_g9477, partial [Aureobasidium melanogenum]